MLTIQRASAGSGKTFKLAKTYIEFFLTITDPATRHTRLRTDEEIEDSIRHILAVTFTNKATAEMKERIVEKLAAIANAPSTKGSDKDPDYMDDLCDVAKAEFKKECAGNPDFARQKVIHAAQVALKALLLDYSNFNVSTIDSFFQTILRTFAYETELNDSYQLELDSDYTASVGVDAMLDKIIGHNASPEIQKWLDLTMDKTLESGQGWNPFQRRLGYSLYSQLLSYTKEMQKEEFKEKQQALTDYFEKGPDLLGLLHRMEDKYEKPAVSLLEDLQEKARKVKDIFEIYGIDMKAEGASYLHPRIIKSLNGDISFSITSGFTSPFKSKSSLKGAPCSDEILNLINIWWDAVLAYHAHLQSMEVRLWHLYKKLLPYVPLMHEIDRNIHEYLDNTNSLQISDTNTLLQRIIGQDDTPFIYERMGTRIEHYLIDEFQDTSKLQWINFDPLLSQSESVGHDNLIIGDAKQSIYRFRNADPSLITTAVPAKFKGHHPAGYSVDENTNWRSLRNIVEFNNLFFNAFAHLSPGDIPDLYSNVVQHAHNRKQEGYVEINFYLGKSNSYNDDGEDDSQVPRHMLQAGEMVASLLSRGYRQKDIAFITRENADSKAIIAALLDYNNHLPDGAEKIQFISDQSLLIANARSVKVIVAALQNIAKGLYPKVRKGDEAQKKGAADWYEISSRFDFIQARNPDLSPDKIVQMILNEENQDNLLSEMLSEMQSVALPSLVESIIDRFVDPLLRKGEAAFLAAFQDAVLTYCESNPTDIASFLDWWNRHVDNLSISSPEGIDAVKIMTIHKSKGLEFDCVIIPKAAMKTKPKSSEWRWKKPDPAFPEAAALPPYLPIEISKGAVEGTIYEDDWQSLENLAAMDTINMAYVGFTRAVKELYVWCPMTLSPKSKKEPLTPDTLTFKNNNTIGNISDKILSEWDSSLSEARFDNAEQTDDLPSLPLGSATNLDKDSLFIRRFTYGSPLSSERIATLRKEKEEKSRSSEEILPIGDQIDEYHVNANRSVLKYREADFSELEESEEADPRAEGTLMHKIMETVEVASDLPRSIRRMRLRGLLSEEEAESFSDFLSAALKQKDVSGWFSGRYRVVSERSILQRGEKAIRPDRIMIDKDGNAIIVDYKFGEKEDKEYLTQVGHYADALRRSGLYPSVKAYLWYVRLQKVVPVED